MDINIWNIFISFKSVELSPSFTVTKKYSEMQHTICPNSLSKPNDIILEYLKIIDNSNSGISLIYLDILFRNITVIEA